MALTFDTVYYINRALSSTKYPDFYCIRNRVLEHITRVSITANVNKLCLRTFRRRGGYRNFANEGLKHAMRLSDAVPWITDITQDLGQSTV